MGKGEAYRGSIRVTQAQTLKDLKVERPDAAAMETPLLRFRCR